MKEKRLEQTLHQITARRDAQIASTWSEGLQTRPQKKTITCLLGSKMKRMDHPECWWGGQGLAPSATAVGGTWQPLWRTTWRFLTKWHTPNTRPSSSTPRCLPKRNGNGSSHTDRTGNVPNAPNENHLKRHQQVDAHTNGSVHSVTRRRKLLPSTTRVSRFLHREGSQT